MSDMKFRPAAAFSYSQWLSASVIPSDRKLLGIHGLRAVAALTIVVFHTRGIPKLETPDWLWLVPNRFGLAVHLFFLLSAFSLAHSTKMSSGSLRTYWIKRFFRIAPLFYALLLGHQLWFGYRPLSENILSILFAFNLVPSKSQGIVWASWTIGVEMLFYAALPVLLSMALTRVSAFMIALAGVTVSTAGRILIEATPGIPASYAHEAFVSNLGIFCLGLFAYRMYADSSNCTRDGRYAGFAFLLYAALLLGPLRSQVLPGRFDVVLWALAFALLSVWQAPRPSPFLSNAFMQFVGERSYSVYLLHPIVIYALRDVYHSIYAHLPDLPGVAFVACSILSIAIVLPCADLTYRFVEVPGIRFGRWLTARTAVKAAESDATT